MKDLFDNPNRAFASEVVRLWCGIRETIRDDILSQMNKFLNAKEGRAMEASYVLDNLAWNHKSRWFDYDLSRQILWFWIRYDWLDGKILDLRVPYDINLDGVVNVSDVTTLIGGILGNEQIYDVVANVNGDDYVNVADVTELIQVILNN